MASSSLPSEDDDDGENVGGMNALSAGWFTESDAMFRGFTPSIRVESIQFEETTDIQQITVFKTKSLGTVLALDNAIQCTEFDEFSYQEMISFLPLNSHPNPENVLIIGGGDGGVAREVVKHPGVVNVIQCEIDKKVIDVAKEYMPFMAVGFKSPKLTLHIEDGVKFLERHSNAFDVIITDSSDPIGPAKDLFEKSYYEKLRNALKPGGIISSQCESMWFSLDLISDMMNFSRKLFPVVSYAFTTIPTYPGGHIGFLLCSLNPDITFSEPIRKFTDSDVKSLCLRYYNYEIHKAAFVLPQFVREALSETTY